jgi:hypothetical protein
VTITVRCTGARALVIGADHTTVCACTFIAVLVNHGTLTDRLALEAAGAIFWLNALASDSIEDEAW